jgi:hypothetical protein
MNHLKRDGKTFCLLILQISLILQVIEDILKVDHRDLKVNNMLVIDEPKEVSLGKRKITFPFYVVFIDFGFACVGCPPPKAPTTVFQAGSWFPMGELCCKAGRDLAQLIFCIHCYFPVTEYLTPAVATVVKSWMQIPWSGGIANALEGFTKEGRPRRAGAKGHPEYNTGIYEFLRRPDVDPTTCSPIAIFKACQSLAA